MIVDTSVLFGFFDAADPDHDRCAALIDGADDDFVVSPYVLTELDYLITTRRGVTAELAALTELGGGAWDLANLSAEDVNAAIRVIAKYGDQNIGVADASLVVLADRYRMRTIATLDRRHFEVVRPLSGGRFRIVP